MKLVKIMVMDDEAVVRMVIRSHLEEAGYSVVEVDNGVDGVETALREKPDLILSDVMMPGQNGFEACEKMKAYDELKDVPVIFLTSMKEKEYVAKSFEAGGVDYIPKPFDKSELLARIKTHLKLKSQRVELEKKNERLIRDLQTAVAFQKSLLPMEAAPCAVKWAAMFKPAHFVAGDIYDVINLNDDRVGVLMADVCGHDVSSAMVGAMLKMDFAHFSKREESPAQVFNIINRRFIEAIPDGTFITAYYGIIDKNAGTLKYTSAGHPPGIIHRKKTGKTEEFLVKSFPLGILEEAEYEDFETYVNTGDRLFLYTDGVTEIANDKGEFFNQNRLEESIKTHAGLTPEEAVGMVEKDLLDFIGDVPPEDDRSLVVIEPE